jgi:hypothetical protein
LDHLAAFFLAHGLSIMLHFVNLKGKGLAGAAVKFFERAFQNDFNIFYLGGSILLKSPKTVSKHRASGVTAIHVGQIRPGVHAVEDTVEDGFRCHSEEVTSADTLSVLINALLKAVLAIPVINCPQLSYPLFIVSGGGNLRCESTSKASQISLNLTVLTVRSLGFLVGCVANDFCLNLVRMNQRWRHLPAEDLGVDGVS